MDTEGIQKRIAALEEERDKLFKLNDLVSHPQWPILLSTVDNLERDIFEHIMESKNNEQMFHFQGQIRGLRYTKELGQYIKTQAGEINRRIAGLQEMQKEENLQNDS